METTATTATTGVTSAQRSNTDVLRDIELDDFLQLMIAELQNQDPLNPLENNEILQQVSQIREIGATNQLNETLAAVLFGQNVTNASSLIGKEITALDSTGDNVEGTVDKVTIAEGNVTVHLGERTVELKNVREIIG